MERWWLSIASGCAALLLAVVMVIYRDGQNDAEFRALQAQVTQLEEQVDTQRDRGYDYDKRLALLKLLLEDRCVK